VSEGPGGGVPKVTADPEAIRKGAEDRDLLAAHVAGDAEAFGILFARHRDRLWAVALRTSGDREEAADALQDGLISAFRRAESFRGDAAVSTWLHRIVVNACLDRIRRRKVRLAGPLPEDLDTSLERGSALPTGAGSTVAVDPAAATLGAEQRAEVRAALDTLPADQKAALVLVDMEGYSVQEAAAILECPPGTVKSRCSRGRSRLLPLLSDLVEAPTPTGAPGAGNPGSTSHVQDSDDVGTRLVEGGSPP